MFNNFNKTNLKPNILKTWHMEAIVLTIISGLFSLAGIWYQNYLSNRSNNTQHGLPQAGPTGQFEKNEQQASINTSALQVQIKRRLLRIFFTVVIAVLPWLISRYTIGVISSLAGDPYNINIAALRWELGAYVLIWVVIMVIALLSGWKQKTVFEKVILIVSAVFLIYMGYTHYGARMYGWPV